MARNTDKFMVEYSIYKYPATKLKKHYSWKALKSLLDLEIWSPYLGYNLLRLITEFEETEDYEYCQILLDFLNKQE